MDSNIAPNIPNGQVERMFSAASTFMSGVMAISATQMLGAPLKAIDPKFYESYMSFTKQSFGVLVTTMTQWWSPTIVRVSGDASIPKQLFKRADGSLQCKFPKRLVMMANHQLYTDWLYLWWVAYTNDMHGHIYIILKESLKKIPIVGWGCQFYNFIFLARNWEQDKPQFEKQLKTLKKPSNPMWLLIFPEGTNLSKGTRERSAKWAQQNGLQDMRHQLLPRSRGLQFCLQNLKASTEWLYDCTIAYEGIPPGQYGQDIYTLQSSMFEGKPPKSVNMHFRRFRIADIPVDDDVAFGTWLRNRWREKDYLLEHFAMYNSFPKSHTWLAKQEKSPVKRPDPAPSIETSIRSNNIEEFLSIFAPLTSIIMVLIVMNGGGDTANLMKMIQEAAEKNQNAQQNGKKLEVDPHSIKDIQSWVEKTQQSQTLQPTVRGSGSTRAPASSVAASKRSVASSGWSTVSSKATVPSIIVDRATYERLRGANQSGKNPSSNKVAQTLSKSTPSRSQEPPKTNSSLPTFKLDKNAVEVMQNRAKQASAAAKVVPSVKKPKAPVVARPNKTVASVPKVQASPAILGRFQRKPVAHASS